ncbi:MAG: 2-C-methyl-D-erythritol 4-phosphate cytidylyltransferase, partial [Hyphomicrobiaceae bacterium]
MSSPPKTAAVIVAAGRGLRADTGGGAAKQYVVIAGRPVLTWTLQAFLSHPRIDIVQVVIHADDSELYTTCLPADQSGLLSPVTGGTTRQISVRLGLEALAAHQPDNVLIHDAARPLVDQASITGAIDALAETAGAIVAVPVGDTIKRVGDDGIIAETVERSALWRALTPQAFRFADILEAHAAAASKCIDSFTDDAAIAEFAGIETRVIAGHPDNIKITTPGDFVLAERLLPAAAPDIRNGQGFDVHRFGPGDHVCLCGIEIAHDQALLGHSDADVAMHALTDAILGALADGDIGQHFPPSDERWRGAASDIF